MKAASTSTSDTVAVFATNAKNGVAFSRKTDCGDAPRVFDGHVYLQKGSFRNASTLSLWCNGAGIPVPQHQKPDVGRPTNQGCKSLMRGLRNTPHLDRHEMRLQREAVANSLTDGGLIDEHRRVCCASEETGKTRLTSFDPVTTFRARQSRRTVLPPSLSANWQRRPRLDTGKVPVQHLRKRGDVNQSNLKQSGTTPTPPDT